MGNQESIPEKKKKSNKNKEYYEQPKNTYIQQQNPQY